MSRARSIPILIPSSSDEPGAEPSLTRVRPLEADETDRRTAKGKRLWARLTVGERKVYEAAVELHHAVEDGDSIRVQAALERMDGLEHPVAKGLVGVWVEKVYELPAKDRDRRLRLELSRTYTELTEKVKVVLWPRNGDLVPALYCPRLSEALILHRLWDGVK